MTVDCVPQKFREAIGTKEEVRIVERFIRKRERMLEEPPWNLSIEEVAWIERKLALLREAREDLVRRQAA